MLSIFYDLLLTGFVKSTEVIVEIALDFGPLLSSLWFCRV
jgi:hypothetical protein